MQSKVLREPEVLVQAGFRSKQALRQAIAAGRFPRSIKISARSVGWVAAEVDAWLAARVAERDAAQRAA